MTDDAQREIEYYAAMFKHMQHKKYELFVVSKIIHNLNDRELEFTTQQLVRDGGKYFLLDLYFPQFRLAIEVDESYHEKKEQIKADKIRKRAVENRAQIKIERISVSDRPIGAVYVDIDAVVRRVREMKADAVKDHSFVPFVYGNRYKADHWIAKGRLSTSDPAKFRTHEDVAGLFNRDKINRQVAVVDFAKNRALWFPKWHVNNDWINTLSADGEAITMEAQPGGQHDNPSAPKRRKPWAPEIYVFGHHPDVLGQAYYTFDGVFTVEREAEDCTKFRRVCTSIKLPSGDHQK